jgi:F1F0 ATPase subunit 2
MSDTTRLILNFFSGLLLGIVFFGGLWMTVNKTIKTNKPAMLFLISFVLRMGLALFVFYLISLGGWQSLFICVIGFISARFAILRFTEKSPEKKKHFELKVCREEKAKDTDASGSPAKPNYYRDENMTLIKGGIKL